MVESVRVVIHLLKFHDLSLELIKEHIGSGKHQRSYFFRLFLVVFLTLYTNYVVRLCAYRYALVQHAIGFVAHLKFEQSGSIFFF